MAQRLSFEERARVEAMAAVGVGFAEIARRLGRDPSTVWREIDRSSTPGGYDAEVAQAAADARARRPKTPVLAADPELAAAVTDGLRARRSPHALSASCVLRAARSQRRRSIGPPMTTAAHGACPRAPGGCCRDAAGGASPGPPHPKAQPTGRFPAHSGPAGRRRRAQRGRALGGRPDHRRQQRLGGGDPRERCSRQTLAVALPAGYDAHHTAVAVTAALARQPRHLVRTLTWDQGREMARWADIEAALGIEVYFCEPRSPWQRPTNEQTNGLLRRWLPKSTDLNIGPVRLAIIEDHLNTMPRKLHDWHSAQHVYAESDLHPPVELALPYVQIDPRNPFRRGDPVVDFYADADDGTPRAAGSRNRRDAHRRCAAARLHPRREPDTP